MTILPKGTILNGPDGQAYELTEDVASSTLMRSEQLKPIGETPPLEITELTDVPEWVMAAQRAEFAKKRAEASE